MNAIRFYQKLRFRLIAGTVLLVLVVAVLLTLVNQGLSREVLRKREMNELFNATNLRFHEALDEILTLRGDMAGLANGPAVRRLQWARYYKHKWLAAHPPDMADPDVFLADSKSRAAADFDNLFQRRPHYLRIEYFADRENVSVPPFFVRSNKRAGFSDQTGRPLAPDDTMVQREKHNDWDVSFSHVEVWGGERGAPRNVVLQACLPIVFASTKHPPGLLVVTMDFSYLAKALTRSPSHLVFLAGGNRELLLYPQAGRPADYVLKPSEINGEERRFAADWLTNNQGLEPDPSFKPALPVKSRYLSGPPFHDDNWEAPADLQFLLLRCRIADSVRKDHGKRQALNDELRDLQTEYPNLVVGADVNPTKDELLIRGWPSDRQTLIDVREILTKKFGKELHFLGQPLSCKHFGRILYKFTLAPIKKESSGHELLPQCLYVAMATPREAIMARISDNWPEIWWWVIVCVAGAIALAVLGSFLVTRRLNAITAATQALAAGNTEVHLPVRDSTEIGVLARSFAFMAGQIQERERDLTERTGQLEAANAQLADARDKAEQVSTAKDFFLATVSHELRTPLNHVIGFIQLLEMTDLNDDQQHDLHKISHAADNLLALVNDLLDYQKIVQGVLTLEPANFDLAGWVSELADDMRPKVAQKGNQLVVDCPADIGSLDADEKRVRQALTNLLTNAAKFTHDGTITVQVRRERNESGEWVCVDVRDTGRGMTPQEQAKLFQPFTKLLARSDNPEGTGLGLALSQRLCRLMGGDLILSHSEPGQGSTFTMRLPAMPTTADLLARPTTVTSTPTPSAKPASVLVIDDDPDVRELMRRHLEGQGFTVHLAASGAEGLEMVKRLRPDAITLDVLMPGIDGWGTLAALQADAETAHIPVILITMLDDRTRGFALGAWEVLPKPISWSRLVDLLRHIEPNTGPVLLVDDDPALRELAGRTIRQHGWEVCCAADGRAALEAAARRKPSLVLLDLLMPIMDGFEFLEAFRKEPDWREIPVIVLTSRSLTDEERRRLDGSVQRILFKGLSSLDDMLREVEWLLRNPDHSPRP